MSDFSSREADYFVVAASQTKKQFGNNTIPASGSNNPAGTGVIRTLTIIPATTSPGAVTLYDGSSGSAITVFTGGATSVADLKPITLFLGMKATTGPWLISTGANVSVIACGRMI